MTDHPREKWVAIGEITCARTILPNNDADVYAVADVAVGP